MNFSFNAAAPLVAADIRPRLFFGPRDIPRIRRSLDTPMGRKLWRRFVMRSRALAGIALAADDVNDMLATWCKAWNLPGTKVVFGIKDIAALVVLDNDDQAFEACRRLLAACPAAEELSLSASQGRQRLGYMTGFYLSPAYDMIAGRLSKAERKNYCDWAQECAIRKTLNELDPRLFFSPGGNIPIAGLDGALMTALVLHGDRCARIDRQTMERLITMMDVVVGAAIGPDGYPLEDIGYGTHVTAKLAFNIECARRLGVADLSARYPRYHKFGRAILHFTQPWGEHLSNTGDHGDDFGLREFVLPRLAEDTGDPALLWLWQTLSYNHGAVHPINSDNVLYGEVALGKKRQVPPTLTTLLNAPLLAGARRPKAPAVPTAYLCRRRGLVSFRSGWHDNDSLLIFDSSQRSDGAQGHHHSSAGHFSFSALGEYFSIDTGRYNIEQSCHSLVLVNARQQRNRDEWSQALHEGRLTDYLAGDFVDTAACDATPQYGSAVRKAERRVALVKGPGAPAYAWVVDAINANDQMAEFDWQMQCAPESRITTRRNGATVTGFRHGNLLDVSFLLPLYPGNHKSPDAHQLMEVISDLGHPNALTYLGFDSPEKIARRIAEFDRPADMIHGPVYERPRLVFRFKGWNGRALALLVPRKRGAKQPKVTQLEPVPGAIAAQIAFADVTDTIIVGFNHPVLRAGGVDERGGWCVVRRRNRDGKVLRRALGCGII